MSSCSPVSSVNGSTVRKLSPRELEIIYWISEGKTNPEIALILGIKTDTVKHHVTNICTILDVGNRTLVARWYWENFLTKSGSKGKAKSAKAK